MTLLPVKMLLWLSLNATFSWSYLYDVTELQTILLTLTSLGIWKNYIVLCRCNQYLFNTLYNGRLITAIWFINFDISNALIHRILLWKTSLIDFSGFVKHWLDSFSNTDLIYFVTMWGQKGSSQALKVRLCILCLRLTACLWQNSRSF